MSIIDTFGRMATRYRAARAAARTERLIVGLPADIRKDIGWPEAYRSARDTGAGHWAGRR